MCDSIFFKNGDVVSTVRQFQDTFKVDAKQFDFDGNEQFLDCCLCQIDLQLFFKTNPQHRFEYDCGDWIEK